MLQKGRHRHMSLDLYLFPGAGPLFQPWAAEILQTGAPQPDVQLGSIWIFLVSLPHTEAVPLSALSVPALSACELCFLFVADPLTETRDLPQRESEAHKQRGQEPRRADSGTASVCGKDTKMIQMEPSWASGCGAPFWRIPLTAGKGVQHLEKDKGLNWCGRGASFWSISAVCG